MTRDKGWSACLAILLAILAAPAALGQQPQEGQIPPTVTRPPAARYSPLAAHGGYQSLQTTWYDAMLHSLNPRNIDWGKRWELRREAFIENTFGNKYFVFCGSLMLLFYAALLAIGWIMWDHRKDIGYFETELVKARNWATYWKRHAVEAIAKHNEHIEKCNRVIEAGESGIPVGDAAEAMELRHELERTRSELQNATSEKLRLKSELDEKAKTIIDLSVRVDAVSKKIGNGKPESGTTGPEDKAALVARINRLEAALATATQENRRLKGS